MEPKEHPQAKLERILTAIEAAIPDNFSQKAKLKHQLFKIRRDSTYRAPEAMYLSHIALAEVLEETLGRPDEDWKVAIAQIVQKG